MKEKEKAERKGAKLITFFKSTRNALMLIIDAILILYWLETISRGGYEGTSIWLMESTQFVAYGFGVVFSALLALSFLFGRLFPAVAICNTFFMIVGGMQYFKMGMRGTPIQYADITLFREGLSVFGNMLGGTVGFTQEMIMGFVLMVLCVPILFIGRSIMKKKMLWRIICLLMTCVWLAGFGAWVALLDTDEFMLLEEDYEKRGFIVSFLGTTTGFANSDLMSEPEEYSRERVQDVLAPYVGSKDEPNVLPDILFVMSESLFDISKDLELSQDPMGYFKQLQEQYWGGNYLTKVYGGGTAIAEYEVLTGYPVEDTAIAFSTSAGSIKNGMDSILSVLKSYDYYTQAIHPNSGNFYGRKGVYSMMGFDSLLFSETMEKPPVDVFPYPSDEYMFDQLIKAYESRPVDRPWFCHSITFQNHGGYAFESNFTEVEVLSEVNEENGQSVHNYVNMIKISDHALQRLIEYFNAQERPIVIVMWGDHAPDVRQFGLEVPNDPMEGIRYYTTPLLIYNNFGLKISDMPQNISAYRLGACVLNALGLERDTYFNYLSSDNVENLTFCAGLLERDGQFFYDGERYNEVAETIKMLHYDRLFGERYGEEL